MFPLAASAAFCALQARPHVIWARFFGSTLEDRLRYAPSDCFETFPLPEGWATHPTQELNDARARAETRAGATAGKTARSKTTKRQSAEPDGRDLFS